MRERLWREGLQQRKVAESVGCSTCTIPNRRPRTSDGDILALMTPKQEFVFELVLLLSFALGVAFTCGWGQPVDAVPFPGHVLGPFITWVQHAQLWASHLGGSLLMDTVKLIVYLGSVPVALLAIPLLFVEVFLSVTLLKAIAGGALAIFPGMVVGGLLVSIFERPGKTRKLAGQPGKA